MKHFKTRLYKYCGVWVLRSGPMLTTFKSWGDAWAYIWGDRFEHGA